MLTRIQIPAALALFRRELPRPVDVINLISTSNFERYRWYALLVLPALTAVGGRVLWMGRFDRSLAGDRQADKLLVVRYPSHRSFLAMTLNPYYFAINLLREAGVSRFEASFTHATLADPDLGRRRLLVGVHFSSPPSGDALPAVTALLAEHGCEPVYATRAIASLGILDPPRPTDPNPLSLPQLALFAVEREELGGVEAIAGRLAEICNGCSIQAYRREPRRTYRPSLRPVTQPAGAPGA